MTTDNFENSKPKETSENFDQNATSGLSDRMSADLYKDMGIFENKNSTANTLPPLEIAGLGNETAMMAMQKSDSKAESKAKPADTPAPISHFGS